MLWLDIESWTFELDPQSHRSIKDATPTTYYSHTQYLLLSS
jgi:hypothetical protein